MKKKKKVNLTEYLSFKLSKGQSEKLQNLSSLTGMKVSAVVRELIDSAIPQLDIEDRFWDRLKNSGVFKMELPKDTIVPFVANWLRLPLTGVNEISHNKIDQRPDSGLVVAVWTTEHIRRLFYAEGVRECEREQSKPEGTATEP